MMKVLKSLPIAALALLALSCSKEQAEFKTLRELASPQNSITVPQEGGRAEFQVYASGRVRVTVLETDPGAADVDTLTFNGDHVIGVEFGTNEGMRRMAELCLSLDGGKALDTLYAMQEGVQAYLDCVSPYKVADGSSSGLTLYDVSTNIPFDSLTVDISYQSGGEGWIRSVSEDLAGVVVETIPASSDACRGQVKLNYVDGWGENLSTTLYITMTGSGGQFGRTVSFADVKALAGNGTVEDDICVEGTVISDYRSANMELNPSVNYDEVDTSENGRTAYIQSADGREGLRLKFKSEDENILTPGVGLTVCLRGATVAKDSLTDSYTVSGLDGSNMLKSVSADGSLRPRSVSIGSLTDTDIYTYVSIPDMEFVCKFGSYANVYENYALRSSVNSSLSGNNNRLDGWATLLADGQGGAIYAPVNMLCTWRRSGAGVPQGRGPLTGIVVSNDLLRYGDVGRYQIRVLDESGFGQEWEGAGAFTTIAEWDGAPYQYRFSQYGANPRYKYNKLETIVPSDDFSSSNTTPRGELTVENHELGAEASYPLNGYSTYTYVTAENRGDWPSEPVETYRRAMRLCTEIKGWYEWSDDGQITGYKGVVLTVNTTGVSGTLMQLHYGFSAGTISASTSRNFPAHWCSEYSTDGGSTWKPLKDAATGGEYVHLRSQPWWDVNIGGVLYRTSSRCGLGCTEHLAYMGADAFGLAALKIRIRPYDNVMATFPSVWSGDTETARIQSNTTVKDTRINFDYIDVSYK